MRHEDKLKDAAASAKGNRGLAVQLGMEDDLGPTRELSEFVTFCREAGAGVEGIHALTAKTRAEPAQAWRAFEPLLPAQCDLGAAAA